MLGSYVFRHYILEIYNWFLLQINNICSSHIICNIYNLNDFNTFIFFKLTDKKILCNNLIRCFVEKSIRLKRQISLQDLWYNTASKLYEHSMNDADVWITITCMWYLRYVHKILYKLLKRGFVHELSTIPVVARSKVWVCGRSFAGIAGSNLPHGLDVCLL